MAAGHPERALFLEIPNLVDARLLFDFLLSQFLTLVLGRGIVGEPGGDGFAEAFDNAFLVHVYHPPNHEHFFPSTGHVVTEVAPGDVIDGSALIVDLLLGGIFIFGDLQAVGWQLRRSRLEMRLIACPGNAAAGEEAVLHCFAHGSAVIGIMFDLESKRALQNERGDAAHRVLIAKSPSDIGLRQARIAGRHQRIDIGPEDVELGLRTIGSAGLLVTIALHDFFSARLPWLEGALVGGDQSLVVLDWSTGFLLFFGHQESVTLSMTAK